ncbi:hypothetical protein ACFYXH_22145 [Streptomyces sp. NPDC002730]
MSDHTYVVVSLVPDLSGDFTLDTMALRAFREETLDAAFRAGLKADS